MSRSKHRDVGPPANGVVSGAMFPAGVVTLAPRGGLPEGVPGNSAGGTNDSQQGERWLTTTGQLGLGTRLHETPRRTEKAQADLTPRGPASMQSSSGTSPWCATGTMRPAGLGTDGGGGLAARVRNIVERSEEEETHEQDSIAPGVGGNGLPACAANTAYVSLLRARDEPSLPTSHSRACLGVEASDPTSTRSEELSDGVGLFPLRGHLAKPNRMPPAT
mmetsp:Transcript_36480/g.100463  ORF Transcript_36480/g.100463 Transcript_36480/m.100463 type:complete len:219 (-) Transcript_36480:231-887(-)